jgi:hypothetical protein
VNLEKNCRVVLVVLIVLATSFTDVLASGRGAGGFRRGWPHHFGFRPGFPAVRVHGPRFGFGLGYGFGPWGPWGYPYWNYPYYYPPVLAVPTQPPVYIERANPTAYWYYCYSPAGYYPTVRSCPGGWRPVAPTARDP